jgi:hypothetical protein
LRDWRYPLVTFGQYIQVHKDHGVVVYVGKEHIEICRTEQQQQEERRVQYTRIRVIHIPFSKLRSTGFTHTLIQKH